MKSVQFRNTVCNFPSLEMLNINALPLVHGGQFCNFFVICRLLSNQLPESQTVWIQIRTDIMSGSKLFTKVIRRLQFFLIL